MCSAVPARLRRVARLILGVNFEIFVCIVTLGEARRDYFSQCNAGANVVQA